MALPEGWHPFQLGGGALPSQLIPGYTEDLLSGGAHFTGQDPYWQNYWNASTPDGLRPSVGTGTPYSALEQQFRQAGYQGPLSASLGQQGGELGFSQYDSPEAIDWLRNSGYTAGMQPLQSSAGWWTDRGDPFNIGLFDPQGQMVGDPAHVGAGGWNFRDFGTMAAIAAGAGYANGAFSPASGATNPALIESAAGSAGYGASSAGPGGVVAGATNPALIDSAAGTSGYGASSAGPGGTAAPAAAAPAAPTAAAPPTVAPPAVPPVAPPTAPRVTPGNVLGALPVAAGLLGDAGGSVSSQTTNPPEWLRPYLERYLDRAEQTANTPYSPYPGQTVAPLTPYQTAGIDATAQRAMQGSPLNQAAGSEVLKTLQGGYLQGNPYMDEVINKTLGDVTRNYNNVIRPQQDSLMARSGSFGNSGVQGTINEQVRGLGETLGGISSNMRYQDYNNERGRMQGAVGMAPTIAGQDYVDTAALFGAGQQYQNYNQLNLSDQYQRWQEQQNYPVKQLDIIGKGLGLGGQNAGSTSSATSESNPWAQWLGTGLTAASLWGMGKSNGWWGG